MKPFFKENMPTLFEKLILPNIGITKYQADLFED